MEFLWQGVLAITPQQLVMYVVGGLLIWLAIEKGFEPDAVERGEGCLCGGEIGGKSHQDDEGRKHTDTGTVKVHNKGINSAFFFINFRLPWERFPRSIPYLFSDCNG